MKQPITIFMLFIFCACGQKKEQGVTAKENISSGIIYNSDTQKVNKNIEKKKPDTTIREWEKHEDYLRDLILKSKENTILKKSFLQEMYIRNVVTILKDSLFIKIPFDLHGPDCGAPDCYSTDISFSLFLGNPIIFPGSLKFYEHEHGCVDIERKLSGIFTLVEHTDNYVVYHAAQQKSTLVLFSSDKDIGTTAFYFTEVGAQTISGKNVVNILKNYNEEDAKAPYPFTSWILTTKEYENFIR